MRLATTPSVHGNAPAPAPAKTAPRDSAADAARQRLTAAERGATAAPAAAVDVRVEQQDHRVQGRRGKAAAA
jgi:hypothetical protein